MANAPTYILYHGKATSKDREGKKIWTRIGAGNAAGGTLTRRAAMILLHVSGLLLE